MVQLDFSSQKEPEFFDPIPSPEPTPKRNFLVTVFSIGLSIIIVVGAVLLYLRKWDPFWNPFRPTFEQVIVKALSFQEIESFYAKSNTLISFKNTQATEKQELVPLSDFSSLTIDLVSDYFYLLREKKSKGSFSFSIASEGEEFFFGFDSIVIDKDFYFKITTLPSIVKSTIETIFPEIQDKWISYNPERFDNWLKTQIPFLEEVTKEEKKKKDSEKRLDEVKAIFEENLTELFVLQERLPDKKQGGLRLYGYRAKINKETLRRIIFKIDEIHQKYGYPSIYESIKSEIELKNNLIISEMDSILERADWSTADFNCENFAYKLSCERIEKKTEEKPIMRKKDNEFCAYAPLVLEGYFYCIDNNGGRITSTFPGGGGYCQGNSYRCPLETTIEEAIVNERAKKQANEELDNLLGGKDIVFDFWVDSKDFYLRQLSFSYDFQDKGGYFGMGSDFLISLVMNIEFSQYNEPFVIEPPAKSEPLENLMVTLFSYFEEMMMKIFEETETEFLLPFDNSNQELLEIPSLSY